MRFAVEYGTLQRYENTDYFYPPLVLVSRQMFYDSNAVVNDKISFNNFQKLKYDSLVYNDFDREVALIAASADGTAQFSISLNSYLNGKVERWLSLRIPVENTNLGEENLAKIRTSNSRFKEEDRFHFLNISIRLKTGEEPQINIIPYTKDIPFFGVLKEIQSQISIPIFAYQATATCTGNLPLEEAPK